MTEYIIKAADWAIDYKGESLFKECQEIVRCRDCEHYEDYGGCCMRRYQPMAVTPDGFCAWAERRERQNLTENG